MPWEKPTPADVFKAIEVYLPAAYGGGAPPAAVRARLDGLRSASEAEFFANPAFERDKNEAEPKRYALRLGNRVYPHMKLIIEPSPDGQSHLFRADTHDQHVRPPPESKEYAMFCQLAEMNQKIAETIDAAWASAGVPTFKEFLRRDLRRRAAASTSAT